MLSNKVKQLVNGLPKAFSSMTTGTKSKYFDLNVHVRHVNVTYQAGEKMTKPTKITTGYIDITSKNPRVTVVGLVGSPGSHNDLKYMKVFFEKHNIRLLAFNWPGSEFSTGGFDNGYHNVERNAFAKAFLEKLGVNKCPRIIVMGHSRGGENALQLSNILAADNWPVIGAMLINSPGFEGHKGITSRWGLINFLAFIIKLRCRAINFFLFPMLDYFYNKMVGLRVADGKVAAAAILPLRTFALAEQAKSIEEIKTRPKIKTFYGYGSKDFLIETYISDEFAAAFTGSDHYVIHDKEESQAKIPQMKESFLSGKQFVTANFTEEGHYLQKTYPEVLIEILNAMIEVDDNKHKV